MANFKSAQALFWTDFETTGLPDEGEGIIDFRDVHVLEVSVILTDFDLNPYAGFSEVIKLTQSALDALKAPGNEIPRDMHLKNGLLAESRTAEKNLAEVEDDIISLIKEYTTFGHGEFMIAGSGVARFDYPLIATKMSKLGKYLAYYPFDIGVERRVSKILAGRSLINPVTASFGDDKAHRSLADVKAHLEEAGRFREFYRALS